jgi:hypothetical protein
MQNNNVGVALSTESVKVGGFNSVSINSNMSNTKFNRLVGASVHEIPFEDYKIQTNVPEHIHSSRLIGTQLRKLFMSGLTNKDYSDYTDGHSVTVPTASGTQKMQLSDKDALVRFYNAINIANITETA